MAAFLAIDTSTSACSVALNIDGVITEDFVVAPQDHTQRLLPMIESLLQTSNLSLHELDAIAFASGPGSFTGLRICLGVVQGLAYGADLPVVGVSTLEIMAATALRTMDSILLSCEKGKRDSKGSAIVVIPALDARMSEIYWAAFQDPSAEQEGIKHCAFNRLIEDKVSSPLGMSAPPKIEDNAFVIGVGNGWDVKGANQQIADHIEPNVLPHAYDLAILAEKYFIDGKTSSAFDAQPTYIRNEVSWAKRKRIRS
ncbi:MAG: tRNA (adenosine(37)-N6)-threonylcarbamoyltransferase complex dimerization subunit type 1 TsaB [Cellvibrionaceae bacterium]